MGSLKKKNCKEMSQNENSNAIAIQPSSMAPAQVPIIIQANQDFNNGLFALFDDCGLTLKTCICPCLTFNSTQKELPQTCNYVPLYTCGWILMACTTPAITAVSGFVSATTLFKLWGMSGWLQTAGACMEGWAVYDHRKAIKEKDNLPPMDCLDCLIVVFCTCCAVIQHERQTHPTTFVVVAPVTAQPVAAQP